MLGSPPGNPKLSPNYARARVANANVIRFEVSEVASDLRQTRTDLGLTHQLGLNMTLAFATLQG
jgi:hypothetical protein